MSKWCSKPALYYIGFTNLHHINIETKLFQKSAKLGEKKNPDFVKHPPSSLKIKRRDVKMEVLILAIMCICWVQLLLVNSSIIQLQIDA